MSTHQLFRNGQIDCIRAFAALSVVLTHMMGNLREIQGFHEAVDLIFQTFLLTFWANGGLHPGVIIFIVLSGYCIHYPISSTTNFAPTLNYWKSYGLRRFFRIAPVLIFGCLLGCIAAHRYDFDINIFLQPIYPSFNAPIGNDVLDTVLAEIWLYALYPFVLIIFKRLGLTYFLVIAGIVFLIPATLVGIFHLDSTWVSRSLYAFYPYWVIGMLAAQYKSTENCNASIIIGIGFIAYCLIGGLVHFSGASYIKSLLLAMLAAYTLSRLRVRQAPWLISCFGVISYSLYAVHLPIQDIWISSGGSPIYLVPVVIFSAIACYWIIERPSHLLARQIYHAK